MVIVAANNAPEMLEDAASPSPAPSSAGDSIFSMSDEEAHVDRVVPPEQRVSIYVQVFQEMIQTVLEHESFLFSEEEIDLMRRFSNMSYPARYLFVRLFARKNGWFRLAKLKYWDEIGNLQAATDELCLTSPSTSQPTLGKNEYDTNVVEGTEAGPSSSISRSPALPHIIVLQDTDEEDADFGQTRDPLTDRPVKEVEKELQHFGLSVFAISEKQLAEQANVMELLTLLSLDELKELAKQLKITGRTTRATVIEAIMRSASSQSTLTGMFANHSEKGKGKVTPARTLRERQKSQTDLITAKALAMLGPCIKLESGPVRLFARSHLLYYRSLSYSEKTLTQAVLARFKIRTYPAYKVSRSFHIFADRQALIDYESALLIERRMEELTGDVSDPSVSRRMPKFSKEDRERNFREAQNLFERVYPQWQQLVKTAQQDDVEWARQQAASVVSSGLEPINDRLTYYRKRFLPGWPLTRVVAKGTAVLARLHEYDREAQVLRELLDQTCFRRGKRGEWCDRLALVLMHHIGGDKQESRREAHKVCREALSHPWTHLIYHNSLQRRVLRLEKALQIDQDQKSRIVAATLRAARKRIMRGERLNEGKTGKHSIWRSSNGAEISVEQLALEQYNREGWKGFHSENGILTTIFALLFYDVIFAPVDGVFETPYQAAPLDLSTDAFSIVRAELVAERLQALEHGNALEILQRIDEEHRPRKTFCVGLRWSYETTDLMEIVQCLSPKVLQAVCRVYAEEWSYRTGGVPDLLLWNFEQKKARFVEVKGPGDVLSETQKVWIDVLMSAGVEVELCSVKEVREEDAFTDSDDAGVDISKKGPKRKRASASLATDDLPAPSSASEADSEPAERTEKNCRSARRASIMASTVPQQTQHGRRKSTASTNSQMRRSRPPSRAPSAALSEIILLSD